MLKRSRALASVALIAVVTGMGAPAWAETLQEAIALAYQTNPTLLAQRANQRALDESIVQARAGLRPQLDVTVSAEYARTWNETLPDTETDGGGASIGLSQTLWTGGRIGHGITAAEADILAGRENLRDTEQTVLAAVIQSYADVIRDTEILRIRQANLTVLQRQLDEATARFEVGEITRTDVAQSEARLAQSEADLANAQAQLSVSRAGYASVVGQSPGDLAPMPVLPGVPTDFDSALETALIDNPGVRGALYNLRSAEAAVARARSEYLPSASINASYGGSVSAVDQFLDLADNTQFRAGATLSVPLFTGGLNGSRVAQALERANAAQITVEGQRRNTLQDVSSAYAQTLSARSTLQAGTEAVRAATVAAEGVRQEAQVGLRTTLDVLNQELELRNAEVTLASARRNEYVAQANLLAAMGRLEGADLDPTLPIYDPASNFNRVKNRGALPWDGLLEGLDRIAAPTIVPATDQPDAPIDQQLKSEIVRTAPNE
ncbi:TolC family outer membrane protein [Brevundimonas sp. Root1279]|uniref:TolC family outer membrane protein n=1 Tax=Brevundimonas sp. Root1279 TaxID=1736443 RepID=UPI0006FDB00B|nr:TolC family outer membrane protein [Brevundimonas sp. Root1279]KQW83871.1 type I secretion protein TolC [Brevundimonas sp. Root1279]